MFKQNIAGIVTSTNYGEAAIALNKSRVKNYNGSVYLQNGQEFQIELFNPSTITKLAKISINGQLISTAGLVLKPGQRVYLERYIDQAKKFLFETYSVANTATTKAAIVNNGYVEVHFYDEIIPEPRRSYLDDIPWTYTTSSYYANSATMDSLIGQRTPVKLASRSKAGGQSGEATMDWAQQDLERSIETGRVEKGDYSNQTFKTYDGNFNSYVTNTVTIKIHPISSRPAEVKDLAVYCTNCGTRNKKGNYKYCPKCGNKF